MKKAKLQEQETDTVTSWLELFTNESLNTITSPSEYLIRNSKLELQLYKYFSTVVPTLLEEVNGDRFLKYNTSTEGFKGKICKPLEYFIAGAVSEDGIKTLQKHSKPQKFCGKVFNVGDLTYSCKTCAQDPTCVFCHFCFHNSVHKDHRYKLHASCGTGGYCDCGDEEAWTSDPACDYHKGGMTNDESWDPFSALPEDVRCRATFVFLFVLQYIMELLIREEQDDGITVIPIDLSAEESEDSYIVMLYNDESHTYEEVISTLMEAIKCNQQQAYQFAAIVDKEGRSAIYTGEIAECEKVVSDCRRLTSKTGKTPLKCKAMHRNIVAHQLIALDLMTWMSEIMDISDGLRRLHCLLTTVKVSGLHRVWAMSFLEVIIQQDTSLWKVARARSHQLFMNAILMDTYGRKEFAMIFAKWYKTLITAFITDDHEHSISVAALSVQIFTVPSLANMLIMDGNILKTCLESFLERVQPAVLGKFGHLNFQESTTLTVNLTRANYILNDVQYLLRHKPEWTPQFSTNFLEAFEVFVSILRLMQGMDSVWRKTQTHVTYEPNWEMAFNLQLGMIPVIRGMLSWCQSNGDILKSAIHCCVYTLGHLQPLNYITVDEAVVVNHDVTCNMVSIHYALSRFLAGLLPAASKYGFNLYELLQMDPDSDSTSFKYLREKFETARDQTTVQCSNANTRSQLQFLEYPLRSLVLSAQVNAQMWKRNGYAIHHQIFCYHNVRFVSDMSDRDILMTQAIACVMDPDHFIKVLLHKHNLLNWSKGNPVGKDKEAAEKESIIAKDFLLLLLYILSERYVSGVSNVTITQIFEREIIHKLSLGPMSRSGLIKNLPFRDSEDLENDDCPFESLIDDILKEVAVYREPGVTGKGVFELKEDLYQKCSKYFIHFTKAEQSKMVEEKKRISKKLGKAQTSFLYPPPSFSETFENVIDLVRCENMLKLIRIVLSKAIEEDRSAEDHVEEVLMIIAVGVMEVQRIRVEEITNKFKFLELLQKDNGGGKSIIKLVDELLVNDSKEFHPIAKWVKQLLKEEIQHEGITSMDVEINVDVATVNKEDEKAEKARKATERKKKMMEQINQMQRAFLENNSSLFNMCNDSEEQMEEGTKIEDLSHPVAIGDKHTSVDNSCMSVLCILCQEEQTIDSENFFVVSSFVNKSTILKTNIVRTRDQLTPELSRANMVNISSCGHIVHIRCWEKYFTSVKERENLPYFQRRSRSCIDVTQMEYLCPLCNSLCNTVLPLLPRAPSNQCTHIDDSSSQNMSLCEFLTYLEKFSAEVMSTSKKECNAPVPRSSNVSSSWASVFSNLLASYSGSEAGASTENFMELFPKKLMKVFGNGVQDKHVSYSVPYSWMACSFTIQSYECSTRIEGNNIFCSVSDRKDKFWHALIQYLANNCMIGVYEPVQNIGNVLFNFFSGVDCGANLSILDADIFGTFISLRFLVGCIQNIFQEEEPRLMNTSPCVIDDVVFKICFVANLVKIYLTAPLFVADENTIDGEDEIIKSWLYIQSLLQINHTSQIDGHKLKAHLLESLSPFMRCCAVFFHYLTGVKFPDGLISDDTVYGMATLQKYLNLPENINEMLSLDILTGEPLVKKMVERWCLHEEVAQRRHSGITSIPCYVQARRLIQLPRDYSVLINRVSGFMCPTLATDSSRMPALCLVCDTILCSQCYCCVRESKESKRYGACSNHSVECCSGVGIFLRIRDSEIVLMYNRSKATFLPSPYLDEYGETDRGFRRGNPLYLNQKRYESLEQLWLRQRIPETIAQAMESNRGASANDWHQL